MTATARTPRRLRHFKGSVLANSLTERAARRATQRSSSSGRVSRPTLGPAFAAARPSGAPAASTAPAPGPSASPDGGTRTHAGSGSPGRARPGPGCVRLRVRVRGEGGEQAEGRCPRTAPGLPQAPGHTGIPPGEGQLEGAARDGALGGPGPRGEPLRTPERPRTRRPGPRYLGRDLAGEAHVRVLRARRPQPGSEVRRLDL